MQTGWAVLEKLQIREVTSHYPNGWLFLVVRAEAQPAKPGKSLGGVEVKPEVVQPYILSRLVVKAKKMK